MDTIEAEMAMRMGTINMMQEKVQEVRTDQGKELESSHLSCLKTNKIIDLSVKEAETDNPVAGAGHQNGHELCGMNIPLEILETILSSLPLNFVLEAGMACKVWKSIVKSPFFWKRYYKKSEFGLWDNVHAHVAGRPDEWAVHFAIVRHNILNSNLIKNPFGLSGPTGLDEWQIVNGQYGLQAGQESGWRVLPNPESLTGGKYFATDASLCAKQQKVDLWKLGLTPAVMRACIPFTIHWGESVQTPENHEGFHEMNIKLVDEKGGLLSRSNYCSCLCQSISQGSPLTEYRKQYAIQGIGSNKIVRKLRDIYFYHGAMSKDNEEGLNGPRIYSPFVRIQLGIQPPNMNRCNVCHLSLSACELFKHNHNY